jgi:hypothetical protein
MKRITVVTLAVAFLAVFAVAAGAQTKMTPQMCTNVSSCADMMTEMTTALRSGKLSPAEEREVISHINQMGRIMQEMSSPTGADLERKHTQEIEQIQDKWRRLREMKRGMQVKPGH